MNASYEIWNAQTKTGTLYVAFSDTCGASLARANMFKTDGVWTRGKRVGMVRAKGNPADFLPALKKHNHGLYLMWFVRSQSQVTPHIPRNQVLA